jgi:hypothetical protein
MSQRKRRELLVDAKVQRALVARAAKYWLYCQLSIALMLVCWVAVTDRPESSSDLFARAWRCCGPALIASVLLLPIVLADAIRLTNRFAEPMVRMRTAMKQFADGDAVGPVHFRKGDFWHDFAEDLDQVIARAESTCWKRPYRDGKLRLAARRRASLGSTRRAHPKTVRETFGAAPAGSGDLRPTTFRDEP